MVVRAPSGHFVRLLSWLPGTPLGTCETRPDSLLEISAAGWGSSSRDGDFDHPAIHREFYWDLSRGFEIIRRARSADCGSVTARVRAADERIHQVSRRPRLATLRRTAIHGDANDFNVLVVETPDGAPPVSGLIDFGDMVHSYAVAELAIAIAYAVLDRPDPLGAASAIVRGFHASHLLTPDEISSSSDWSSSAICQRLRRGISTATASGR